MDLYFQALSKYATFSGRATRSEFWIFILSNIVIKVILSIVSANMGFFITDNPEETRTLLDGLFALAVLLPTIAVMVRRIHDINMSGWWGWLFIPFGLPIMIVGFMESKEEQAQKEKFNTSPISVVNAVLNHSKDAMNKVKPAVADYVQTHQTAAANTVQTHQTVKSAYDVRTKKEENISYNNPEHEIDEDAIYEQVMIEIEEDKKVKATWAKALALSDGDASKETSRYIQLRVSDIIEKKKNEIELEKQKIQSIVAEENVEAQKYAEDKLGSGTEPINKSGYFIILLAVAFVIYLSFYKIIEHNEQTDWQQSVSEVETVSEVEKVKGSVLTEYSNNVRVGNAVDSWAKTQGCANTSWEEFTTVQSATVIQFTCGIDVNTLKTKEDMAATDEELVAAKAAAPAATRAADAALAAATPKKRAAAEALYIATRDHVPEIQQKIWLLEHQLYKKALTDVKLVIQFNVSADKKTFTVGYQGIETTLNNGQTTSKNSNILDYAYRNIKIDDHNLLL